MHYVSVAEVPLERLRISDRHERAEEKNVSRGLIVQDNKAASISSRVSATSRHSSVASLSEQSNRVTEICNNTSSGGTDRLNAEYCVSKDNTPMAVITEYAVRTLGVTSSTAVPNQQSNNSSLRKYAPSSRTKTPASFEVQKSQVNGVSDKYRLVVALQDVSSYLHNGTLTSIEQASHSGNASLCSMMHYNFFLYKTLLERGIMYLIYRKLVQIKWLHTAVKHLEVFQFFFFFNS